MISPLYQTLEDLHDKRKIHGIGVCDLDKEKLQPLFEAAKVKINSILILFQLYSNPDQTLKRLLTKHRHKAPTTTADP